MSTMMTMIHTMPKPSRIVFFGTGQIARYALEELHAAGTTPARIVCEPDRKSGRGLKLTASPVKQLAEELGIPVLQPEEMNADLLHELRTADAELFIVIDYGTFLPRELLDIPAHGCLNMHPSLLPRLRGPSPIRSAILNDEKATGVSIILLDDELDHGPIVAQKKIAPPEWPPRGSALDELLAREGGKLVAQILPLWLKGELEPQPQNHDVATYCGKFTKEDGLLDLAANGYMNLCKIRAFEGWPGTYAFFERGGKRIRTQVLDAHLEGAALVLDTVKPEGKRAMPYADFARSGARSLAV